MNGQDKNAALPDHDKNPSLRDRQYQTLLGSIALETAELCKNISERTHAPVIIVADGNKVHWSSPLPPHLVLEVVERIAAQLRDSKPGGQIIVPDVVRKVMN